MSATELSGVSVICGGRGGGLFDGIYGEIINVGSNPPLITEGRVTNTHFARFQSGSVVMETLQKGGMSSSDVVPPLYFSKITIDEESRAVLANLGPPDRAHIMETKCVVLDCDGPKHVLIHDLDGTLTGKGPDASILARAEFMHETRADPSRNTHYAIPTKMVRICIASTCAVCHACPQRSHSL